MESRYLFPHSWKKWGWILTILGLIPGIPSTFFGYELPVFEIQQKNSGTVSGLFSNWPPDNLSNTIAGILLIIGLILVSFSKVKIEDEFSIRIRLESLQWAVYINYGLLLLAFIFVYGFNFLDVMVYNMFTILIIFIIRFHWIIYRQKRLLQNEK